MNMFNSDQRRTVVVALIALFVGFLMSLAGCDGSGGEPTNDAGVPTSVLLPDGGINPKMNPCGTAPGCTIDTCGWDAATGKCYSTPWCGPSRAAAEPGKGTIVTDANGTSSWERPAATTCDGTGNYPAGSILVWGANVSGSNLSDSYTVAHRGYVNGFLCVPNPVAWPYCQ